MAETVNIGAMAEILSAEIFSQLGWRTSGPKNENTSCVEDSHGRKTHPADVVFTYCEPYEDKITHVLCDLKSYAKGTIKESEIKKALENLNQSLSCARKNTSWKNKYVFTEKSINMRGLLFIYNHDNSYDNDFFELFSKASSSINIDKGNYISVIGPKKILYLSNICANITRLRGKKELPDPECCGFFYPEQQVRKLYHIPSHLPLTLEQIGGSFHIMRYSNPSSFNAISGIDVYMQDKSNELENFQHLFDYLRKYHILQNTNKIRIFIPFSKETTRTNYEKALRIYEENVDKQFAESLQPLIHYEHMHVTYPQFFSQEIGLRNE